MPSWWRTLVGICLWGLATEALGAEASSSRMSPIVRAVQRARPAVVNIRGEKTLTAPEASGNGVEGVRRVNGMGTGVAIDPRGYILTNHHVIDGVKEIQVTLADGNRYIAKLIARDPETDLAIIKIDPPTPMAVIPIGRSDDLLPGETVIAVGNAYGYEHTVTRGIISALHRAVQVSEAQYYEDLIQTDASINPGNSGGPLLNEDGEMIGINVAVRAGAQGIGFAIPVNKAIEAASRLLAEYTQQQAWHGLKVAEVPGQQAVRIEAIEPGSPAAQAGLQPGDLITGVGNEKISRSLDFYRMFLERKPGESVPLVIQRDSQTLQTAIALAVHPRHNGPSGIIWETLGLELRPIPTETFKQQYKTRYRGGLLVAAVRADSPAAEQGILAGDVLVGMHIWETISLENVLYVLQRPDLARISPVKFYVLRGQETLYGYLPVNTKLVAKTSAGSSQ
ncbi:MAG: trypsin-like peptidase domain-containing protein [Thermoguttaceae bacterium]|nr:trypsin-like peptidase domain-containing protein [Thermoguttaceae bacterium]MDW8039588.1 trypsin-like peptidase domain-containing protein [Thermoguttaceae bacterium]